jgi:hypothetical protein
MDSSRRSFLGVLSASAAALLAFRGTASPQTKSSRVLDAAAADPLARLGWTAFNQQIDSEFDFFPRGLVRARRLAKLRLVAMRDINNAGESTGVEPKCFVLNFISGSAPLGQDTYVVTHRVLGKFELFISEARAIDGEYSYTAVINRLLE